MIVNYKNGNYNVLLNLENGSKMRFNDLDTLEPEFPESMDVKITNQCDMGCPFCHEDSKPDGLHGDIMGAEFINTLHPYTELAIGGGNPLSHPDLIRFLVKCQKLRLIPSMTVNQKHFNDKYELLLDLVKNKLIFGLGISLSKKPDEEFIKKVQDIPNAVIHVINKATPIEWVKELYNKNIKLLILGYKTFRRGETYTNIKDDYNSDLKTIMDNFTVVSFDNLALKQLDVKGIVSEDQWNSYYMGDDGQYTMFIDLVNKTFSTSSTTPIEERHTLLDNIKPMFDIIRKNK